MAETENAPVRSFAVEDIARVCHDTIRAIQVITGDPLPAPPWESAGQEMRESTIASVQAVLGGASAEELHAHWCRRKAARGWRRGEFKSEEAKTHPGLVPFADLPESERVKDRVFGAIVAAMSGENPVALERISGAEAETTGAVTDGPERVASGREAPQASDRMAITPEGALKPVTEFSAEEKWWCDGEDCDGARTDPHVHPYVGPALPVDLLTGWTAAGHA